MLLAQLTLMLVCIVTSWFYWREEPQDSNQYVVLICSLLILAGVTSELVGTQGDLAVAARLFGQVAHFAAIPMIALSLMLHERKVEWSKETWGRILLALFAAFELSRRGGWGEDYGFGLTLASVACTLLAAVFAVRISDRILLICATISLGFYLLIQPSGHWDHVESTELYGNLCIAAFCFALLVLKMSEEEAEESEAAAAEGDEQPQD